MDELTSTEFCNMLPKLSKILMFQTPKLSFFMLYVHVQAHLSTFSPQNECRFNSYPYVVYTLLNIHN